MNDFLSHIIFLFVLLKANVQSHSKKSFVYIEVAKIPIDININKCFLEIQYSDEVD